MQNGLERRGYKEVGFLREVEETVGTGIQHLHIFIHLAEREQYFPVSFATNQSLTINCLQE